MLRYTLRSLALLPLALILVHFAGFAFAYLVGPMQVMRQPLYFREVNPEPLLPSYAAHLAALFRAEAVTMPGSSAGESLAVVVGQAALASFGLLAVTVLLSVGLGISLGVAAVRRDPPRVAPWLTVLGTLGLATPTFFLGTLAVTGLIMLLIYGPPELDALLPLQGFGWDSHLVLPTIALMLRPTAQIAQVTAGMMVGEYSRQYVTTARSLGVSEQRIARWHVLRNVVPPVSAAIAGSLRLLVGELIIVESLFYWPGLGRMIGTTLIPSLSSVEGESALFLNPPVLAAILAIFAFVFLLTNLLTGLAARLADPRLRHG